MVGYKDIIYYRRSYRNWFTILIKQALPGNRMKKIIKVMPRNGTAFINVNSWLAHHYVQLNAYHNDNISKPSILNDGNLSFEYKNIPVKFSIPSYAAFLESFIMEDYSWLLPVEGQTVVDIGANIGDTPLYFALNGARKVLALEPFPYAYSTAKKNIMISGYDHSIDLMNCGFGKDGFIELSESVSDTGSELKKLEGGPRIPLISLKTLIEKYSLGYVKELLLKMDCEGCEYNILEEDCSVLRNFKKIQMEYHYGPDKLVEKLNSCHFNVKYTDPKKIRAKESDKPQQIGMIYAIRE